MVHRFLVGVCVPCRMGKVKAAVLPLPVSASPIRSRPCKADGIASACIGVGFLYPSAAQASHNESIMPRSLNDFVAFSAPSSTTILFLGGCAEAAYPDSLPESASDSEEGSCARPSTSFLFFRGAIFVVVITDGELGQSVNALTESHSQAV